MASNVTPSQMPALVVVDPRFTFAEAFDSVNTTAGQAGPFPGTAEPQQDTSMVIESTGTMAAATQMRVRATKGGGPDLSGAEVAWRYQGDADWRGWNRPAIATGWECLDFTTTASKWLYPHAVKLADDTVLVVVQESGTTITVWKRSATVDTWSEITVATHGTYTYGAFPTLCVLPSGRVLCYAWWEDSSTSLLVRMYYSDDSGATWTLGSSSVLPATVTAGGTITPKRLRAACYGGQVLLVAGLTDTSLTYDHILRQYASRDGGSQFTLIETWTGASTTTHAAYHDLVVLNGQFTLGYLASDGTNSLPRLRRIANAYSPFSGATVLTGYDTAPAYPAFDWSTLTGAVIDYSSVGQGDLALAVDEDGVLYTLGRNHGGGGARECILIRSIDDGKTADAVGWSSSNAGSGTWWAHASTTTYPAGWCAVCQAGRILVPSVRVAPGTVTDPSLDVVYLGGYSTVTMPHTSAASIRQQTWERTWWAMTFPESAASVWALTSGGAPTLSLTQTGVRVQGGVGDSEVWTATPTSTLAQGILATVDIRAVSGSGFVSVRSGAAGPITYEIRVEVTPTSIILRDLKAAANIATVTTTAGATGVQVLIAVGEPTGAGGNIGYGAAWYRATGGINDSDQKWVSIGTSTTLTDGASDTTNQIQFGNLTGTTDVYFKLAHYTNGSYTGTSSERLYRGQSNPGDLQGRALTSFSTYLDGGTRIRGITGPAARGDVWNIDTDYHHALRRIWPEVEASPQVGWRSTAETQQDIVWKADPDTSTEVAAALGPRALALFEVNWRNAELFGETAAGAWVSLATIDTASDAALAWTRAGSTVLVDTGTAQTSATYYTENSLARCTFKLNGGTPAYRKIRTNRAGSWTDATTLRPRLVLDGADGTEPTSGTAGELWHRSVVVVLPSTVSYRRYRLRISAQTTADGYFAIGTMLWGHLVPFAQRYARGRIMETQPNVALSTRQSGARSAVVQGRPRRTVQVAWTDGRDSSPLWHTDPEPNYVLPYTGSTEPMGAPAETHSTIHGLAADLASPDKLVVFVARYVPPGSAAAVTITHPDQHLLCRMTTAPRTTVVLGTEFAPNSNAEVTTLETMAFEEEV